MQEDVFNKIIQRLRLNRFRDFCKTNKEILLYLFFGGLAFIVSVTTYILFNVIIGINELIANILSWVVTVLFAYITNKIWVFQAPTKYFSEFMIQLFLFFSGRIVTLVVEEIILFLFVTLLECNGIIVKIFAQVVVIVLNYIISKLFVFAKKKR